MTFCCRYRCRPVPEPEAAPECNKCDYKDEADQRKCEEERQACLVEQKLMAEQGENYVYWSTTVSYRCCQHCNNTVYKADTVINTVHLKDNCETEETSVCRKIPGAWMQHIVKLRSGPGPGQISLKRTQENKRYQRPGQELRLKSLFHHLNHPPRQLFWD